MTLYHTFKFKTHDGLSPQGKRRVYFCAHAEDLPVYFEEISHEVFDRNSCAVYYNDGTGEELPEEEYFDRLGEMNLFVMPVTARLLTDDGCLARREFAFAIKNHIPVLPLMQEPGLEEIFNAKMGDLQFLDKHKRDETAISYDEKLDKYLGSVLIGDELAGRVRASFDAYVFLSYRKKDRKYAQTLMRLIHKNPLFRDIAIWYDEFLTPGENFNDSIAAALDKSKLFALAVTPSLLEKTVDKDGNEHENYIVTTEYPMAVRSGKPILPAELVPTDKGELREKYDGIPDTVDAYDETVLSEMLSVELEIVALASNDSDPSHMFLVGLAYLSGIDVEVDHARAVELITFAAESENREAVEKLVSMYRNGEGVERDYCKAIEWQRRLVDIRRREYEKVVEKGVMPGRITNILWQLYITTFWILGLYLDELRSLDDAEQVYLGIISECESYYEKYRIAETKQYTARAYRQLGAIYESRGKSDRADEYYLKSLALREELASEMKDAEALRELSWSYIGFGDVYKSRNDLSRAEECYRKSLAISEQLAAEDGTVESRRDVSVCYTKLGEVYKRRNNYDEAEEYYRKSLALFEELVAEAGTVELRRHLSECYGGIGDVCRCRDDLDGAEEYYLESYEIRKKIFEQTKSVQSRLDLSQSCQRLGYVYELRGEHKKAEVYYLEQIAHVETVVAETGLVDLRISLSINYEMLGVIYGSRGDLDKAEEYYLKAISLREVLLGETGTVQVIRMLAKCYKELADVYRMRAEIQKAEEYYRKSVALRERLAEELHTAWSYDELEESYAALVSVSDAPEREGWLQRSLELLNLLLRSDPENNRYIERKGRAIFELSKLKSVRARVAEAETDAELPKERRGVWKLLGRIFKRKR